MNPTKEQSISIAERAADWIVSNAGESVAGLAWPRSVSSSPTVLDVSLYSGTAGIILFFLQLYRVTGNTRYLHNAHRAAAAAVAAAWHKGDHLVWSSAHDSRSPDSSLYHGGAGMAWALIQLALITNDPKDLLNAKRATSGVIAVSRVNRWNGATDVMLGAAGIGLFAISSSAVIDDDRLVALAAQAADDLVSCAHNDAEGCWWFPRLGISQQRRYANFAHGTAGMGFFLARLSRSLTDSRYLDQALSAARWLDARKKSLNDGVGWCRHEPGGEELFYFGWCHGPAGTARFFHELFAATGDRRWWGLFDDCHSAVVSASLLDHPHEGFWNLGMCCGVAGVADFLLDCARLRSDPKDRENSMAFTQRLHNSRKSYGSGVAWIQAEHRDKPFEQIAQVGRGHGAAGIGSVIVTCNVEISASLRPSLPDAFATLSHRG